MGPLCLIVACVTCAFDVARDGALVVMRTEDHTFSSWDTAADRPAPGCYTEVLFSTAVSAATNEHAQMLVLGLGGGVLAARFARHNVSTAYVEIDADVIGAYRTLFEPSLARWVGVNTDVYRRFVHVIHGDALDTAALAAYTSAESVAVVDIPACYRDASAACTRMVHGLAPHVRAVAVNVWWNRVDAFGKKMSTTARPGCRGSFEASNDIGTYVWVHTCRV